MPAFAVKLCWAMTWPMVFMSVAVPRLALLAVNMAFTTPGWTLTCILEAAMALGMQMLLLVLSPQSPLSFALMSSPLAMPTISGFLALKFCSVSAVPSAFQRSKLSRYMSPVNCVP